MTGKTPATSDPDPVPKECPVPVPKEGPVSVSKNGPKRKAVAEVPVDIMPPVPKKAAHGKAAGSDPAAPLVPKKEARMKSVPKHKADLLAEIATQVLREALPVVPKPVPVKHCLGELPPVPKKACAAEGSSPRRPLPAELLRVKVPPRIPSTWLERRDIAKAKALFILIYISIYYI